MECLKMTADEVVAAHKNKIKKGLTTTTVIDRIFEKGGRKFGMVSFGDDIMMITNVPKDEIFAVAEKMNVSLSSEPTTRFLGYDYGPGDYETFNEGRNLGNMISKKLSPERKKEFPYTAIGHLGQYYALNEGIRKDFHVLSKGLFEEHVGMEWTSIENMEKQMKDEWLPKILKNSSKIGYLYDALGTFIHGGIDSAEPGLLPSSLEMFAEEEIIGRFLFDPENIDTEIGRLEELHGFDLRVTKILKSITSSPMTWNAALINLARLHNLMYTPGGPIY
jgi:hypothetical protein